MNFGPYPEKRELPSFVQKQSGEELALKLLRQHDALDALHRKELSDVQKQADRLAEQLALLVHKKRFTENDPFVMSLRQLLKNEAAPGQALLQAGRRRGRRRRGRGNRSAGPGGAFGNCRD